MSEVYSPVASGVLLHARGVGVNFQLRNGSRLPAVRDVNLTLHEGEVYGLVGESGAGKSAFCLALLRLIDTPGALLSGEVWWRGRNLMALSEKELRKIRGAEIAFVFQNAQSSLNPSLTIGAQFRLILRHRRGMDKRAAQAEASRLLEAVYLADVARVLQAYPHECSLGMCHRIALAMALSCQPKLLVADEPTASLDLTIQAEIIDLLHRIRDEFGLTMLLVTHDFGVVANLCQRVGVMYKGQLVETGLTEDVYREPAHAHTRALISSILSPDPVTSRRSSQS